MARTPPASSAESALAATSGRGASKPPPSNTRGGSGGKKRRGETSSAAAKRRSKRQPVDKNNMTEDEVREYHNSQFSATGMGLNNDSTPIRKEDDETVESPKTQDNISQLEQSQPVTQTQDDDSSQKKPAAKPSSAANPSLAEKPAAVENDGIDRRLFTNANVLGPLQKEDYSWGLSDDLGSTLKGNVTVSFFFVFCLSFFIPSGRGFYSE